MGDPAATKRSSNRWPPPRPRSVRRLPRGGACASDHWPGAVKPQAVAIYDEVRRADVPGQRILEATRGAILARKEQGIALLLEKLRSASSAHVQMALGRLGNSQGNRVDKALAAEVDRESPEGAALLIEAMADRKETVVLNAVLKAAGSGAACRFAWRQSMPSRVGNASCLSPLVAICARIGRGFSIKRRPVRARRPSGPGRRQGHRRTAPGRPRRIYPALASAWSASGAFRPLGELVKALDRRRRDRSAARRLTSLGTTVPPDKLSVLISAGRGLLPNTPKISPSPSGRSSRPAVRMADRRGCSKELAAGLARASVPTKIALVQNPRRRRGYECPGNSWRGAAKSGDPASCRTPAAASSDCWMTIDAVPVLLDLAKSSREGEKYRDSSAVRRHRVARQFTMTEPERIEMCKKALAAATQPAKQKLVLEILAQKCDRSLETLRLAAKLTREQPKLNTEATKAALDDRARDRRRKIQCDGGRGPKTSCPARG